MRLTGRGSCGWSSQLALDACVAFREEGSGRMKGEAES